MKCPNCGYSYSTGVSQSDILHIPHHVSLPESPASAFFNPDLGIPFPESRGSYMKPPKEEIIFVYIKIHM